MASSVGNDLTVPVSAEAAERKSGQRGFVPEAFRWVVERTFSDSIAKEVSPGIMKKNRRHQESMNFIAHNKFFLKVLIK
jgi:hypothetical protein